MKKIASWQCSRQIRTVHFGEPVHAGMDATATFSGPVTAASRGHRGCLSMSRVWNHLVT